MRKIIASSLVVLLSSVALAQGLPDGIGTLAPSGSSFTTEIGSATDIDDYVFQGYPGMVLTAQAKPGKGSLLAPVVEIIRPGGEVVLDDEGLTLAVTPKSVTTTYKLDVTGWWKVRVYGKVTTDALGNTGPSQGVYSLSVKYTAPVLPTLPQVTKSFKQNGAIFPVSDADVFAFQGFPGQSFSATLTIPKSSALDPQVELFKPDGTRAVNAGESTHEKSLIVAQTLDAEGIWKLRIVGEEIDPAEPHNDLSTGNYTLNVKLGKVTAPGLLPDANHQYRLTIPGTGGAKISYTLAFPPTGPAPTFNAFEDPDGNKVSGFPGGTKVTKPYTLFAGTPDTPTTVGSPALPFGNYTLTFDAPSGTPPANVTFSAKVTLPRGDKKRVVKLSKVEPSIQNNSVLPNVGGPGTEVRVTTNNIVDPLYPDSAVTRTQIYLGHHKLKQMKLSVDGATLSGKVPADIPNGVFDVVVTSTSGQAAARVGAFTRVPPPVVTSIDPSVGPDTGFFTVTMTGAGFREGRMGALIDEQDVPVTVTVLDENTLTFEAPPRSPEKYSFGVRDLDSQLKASLPKSVFDPLTQTLVPTFEYVSSASISRVIPGLIPILGSELITVQGANFAATDHVWVETTTQNTFQDMTLTAPTFVNKNVHQFMAPSRPKGVYKVHVQNSLLQPNPPKTRNLTYYSFADYTASTNLSTIGADKYDGWTNAVSDYDKDGNTDLFISRKGGAAPASTASMTRVLRNGGSGQFTDVTTSVMPTAGTDDWRADRIWLADVNQDSFPDMLITTNSVDVPVKGLSHTRILVNEVKGGNGLDKLDRVFRDRTVELMAVPRTSQLYGLFGAPADVYVSDDWRGLDMWIGDVDKSGAGPPDIVITHDEMKDDSNNQTDVFSSGVYCGNYCSSGQQSFQYSYSFYWGGSRTFLWDKNANGGKGRFRFDANFFPRASGPVVPQFLPGGGTIPGCSPHYNQICEFSFTPFTGQRLAIGHLDTDGKPDVAVLNSAIVQRHLGNHVPQSTPKVTISSLQVALNKFSASSGSAITDMTLVIGTLGGDFRGNSLAIGQPGFPDGNPHGVIAMSKAAGSGNGPVMRLVKWRPPATTGLGDFEEISSGALPPVDGNGADTFQASHMAFLDVDQDGDQDLVLLANSQVSAAQSSFRMFRNEFFGGKIGVLRRTLDPLFTTAVANSGDHFEGEALAIGDVSGDTYLDFVITRAVSSGNGSQTRVMKTDK